MPETLPVPMLDVAPDLSPVIAYSAVGLTLAILLVGIAIRLTLLDVCAQLRALNDHARALRVEGIDLNVEAGALGRPALDAEQLVRGAGFLITLLRGVVKKPGEAIPSVERLTLDLGKAMGVPLPVREEATAFGPGGVTVQSGLLPYGAQSTPAVLDPEAA